MVKLRVRAGESIQDAVRRFRKLCERSGLRKEIVGKTYYEKPSERRRREQLKLAAPGPPGLPRRLSIRPDPIPGPAPVHGPPRGDPLEVASTIGRASASRPHHITRPPFRVARDARP